MSMQGHLKLNIIEVKLYMSIQTSSTRRRNGCSGGKFRRLTGQIINENTIVVYNYLFSIREMQYKGSICIAIGFR